MPSTHDVARVNRPPPVSQAQVKRPAFRDYRTGTRESVEEILAYIQIRDGLLTEAERATTSEALRRASTANDFVASCLRPVRTPYEAQFLTEFDAGRERKRCEAVKTRLAELAPTKR